MKEQNKTNHLIEMTKISVTEVYQTEIDDKWATKLCMWLCEMWMAWSIRRIYNKKLAPWTKADLNRLNDESIKEGGLKKLTDGDSDNGFVTDHEINARVAGLKGYTKIYEKLDDAGKAKLVNLLQWEVICELRDEGKHSMLAIGWSFDESSGTTYIEMFDPWKATNDLRMDLKRGMTQRKVNGKWVDSRSVESFAWYRKNGEDWI